MMNPHGGYRRKRKPRCIILGNRARCLGRRLDFTSGTLSRSWMERAMSVFDVSHDRSVVPALRLLSLDGNGPAQGVGFEERKKWLEKCRVKGWQ
jgi:hypothetical protein